MTLTKEFKHLPQVGDPSFVLHQMLYKQNNRYQQLNAFFSIQKWRSLHQLSSTLIEEQLNNLQVLYSIPPPTETAIISSSANASDFQSGKFTTNTNYKNVFEQAFKSAIGLVIKAYQVQVHALVNTFDEATVSTSQADSILSDLPSFLKQYQQKKEVYQVQLEHCLVPIYTTTLHLSWFDCKEQLKAQVTNLVHNTVTLLEEMMADHNHLQFAVALLQKKKKMGDSERVGLLAVQYNHLIRKIIGSVAGCLHLLLETQQEQENGLLAHTPQLAFHKGQLINGKNKSIHQLNDCAEGDLVEITGMVIDMETYRASNNKLVCKMQLLDPSSKQSVWTVAYYSHLGHAGIEYQSFVTLHGKVHLTSPFNKDSLAIHINKINADELQQQNWSFALLQLAKDYYTVWPNNLAIQWALSIHLHDLDKEIIYRAGAAELFYQPLYRGSAFQAARQLKYSTSTPPKN